MKCGLMLLCLIATTASSFTANAHDMLSDQFISGEESLAEAQAARDEVTSLPDTTADTRQAAESFVATAFVWDHTKLSVCFWQTDNADLLEAIEAQAASWSSGTKISFDFGGKSARQCSNGDSADIRITLKPMPVDFYAKSDRALIAWNWSEYGSLSSILKAKISMSLISATQFFSFNMDNDFDFLIAHEFGHALGLIHEHQRLDCMPYLADKKTVMDAYGFKKDSDYDAFILNFQQIPLSDPALRPASIGLPDANSVMMYNFPQRIWNPNLAQNPCARPQPVQHPGIQDIEAINYLYGTPSITPDSSQPQSTGSSQGPPPGHLTQAAARAALEGAYSQHVKLADAAGLIASARGGVGEKEQREAAASARANSTAARTIHNLLDAIDQATSPDRP
jgi:hypothetical protein